MFNTVERRLRWDMLSKTDQMYVIAQEYEDAGNLKMAQQIRREINARSTD